jgi:tubulin--tyrosine ligase-like protein 12
MNYRENVTLKQVHYNEFIPEFEKQNSDFKWNDIQVR